MTTPTQIGAAGISSRVDRLNVWTRRGERAPHKRPSRQRLVSISEPASEPASCQPKACLSGARLAV
jgi:hypothetical protein